MKAIQHQGITFHVRDDGPRDGRVVMFSNSLGTDLRVWDALIELLPEGLRLVRYDKRGHGLSDCPPTPYSIDDLADDADAVATALELADVTFVGLSIGGLIGQGLCLRRPDLVDGLVLMDTAARIGTPEMWQDRIDALQRDGIAGMADAIMDRWFDTEMRNDTAAIAPWRNMLIRTPLDGYIGCCAAIAQADFTPTARPGAIRIMAMVGAADGATPPALVQDTASLYGADCHVIAGAGHLPCVEQPAEVARLLKDFLEETTYD